MLGYFSDIAYPEKRTVFRHRNTANTLISSDHNVRESNATLSHCFSSFLISVLIYFFSKDAGGMVTKENDQSMEFIQAINALNADSGGDCPEYTFQGILNALGQEPHFGSPMYVFTDAGPKDATADNIGEVKILAEADEITINFLSTGTF